MRAATTGSGTAIPPASWAHARLKTPPALPWLTRYSRQLHGRQQPAGRCSWATPWSGIARAGPARKTARAERRGGMRREGTLHVAYIYSVCGGSKRACLPGPLPTLWACFSTYIPAAPHGEEPGCTEVYVYVEIVPCFASVSHVDTHIGLGHKHSMTHSSHKSADMMANCDIVVSRN